MSFLHSFATVARIATRPTAVAARCMATQARVQPSVFGPTGKLATKLFQESQKSKNLPLVRSELKKFKDTYESSVALRSLFLNPVITTAQRDETLMQVFAQEGIKAKETQNFIKGAAATKNLNRIKQIVSDFDKLVTFELKEVHASVTSAEPLQPAQIQRLEKALKQRISPDEKLLLVSNVDSNLLGGLIVMLDQQLLDLSVAAQVRKIDAAIRN